MPTTGQLSLLIVTIALFVIGGAVSILRIVWPGRTPRIISRCFLGAGIVSAMSVLVWHSSWRGQWVPVGDNFDTLIWLSVLLAMFVLYLQRHRSLGALDWFVMPLVVLMLVLAAILGR